MPAFLDPPLADRERLPFWTRWAIVRRRTRYTLRNVLEDLRYLFKG